jgi:hypothetical protein
VAELLDLSDRRRETVLDQATLLAGPKAGKDENWLADAGIAELRTLRYGSDTKPVGARFDERSGYWDGAVTIRVSLHNSEDFPTPANVATDGTKIVIQSTEGNLGPHGTSIELNFGPHDI